jgi:hypothetical protein
MGIGRRLQYLLQVGGVCATSAFFGWSCIKRRKIEGTGR